MHSRKGWEEAQTARSFHMDFLEICRDRQFNPARLEGADLARDIRRHAEGI